VSGNGSSRRLMHMACRLSQGFPPGFSEAPIPRFLPSHDPDRDHAISPVAARRDSPRRRARAAIDDHKANEESAAPDRGRIADSSLRSPLESARSFHNILVVDDDEQVLRLWKRTARGHNVFTATDAATARQLANAEGPDLAIVDLRLGGASGVDLIRELKRDLPDLVVVLYSGYLSVATAVAAVRAGADLVVFKPVTFHEILQRLETTSDEPGLEDTPTLARAEWEHITRVLADCNGNVSMAARRLGIYRSSLQRRLRKYAPRS